MNKSEKNNLKIENMSNKKKKKSILKLKKLAAIK